MSNDILTNKSAPGIVAKLAAGQLADAAMFMKTCDKEDSSTFGQDFKNAQPGDTIYVKKPARFTVGSSFDLTSALQDVKEEKVALTLDKVASIGIKMNTLEIAYNKGIKKWNEDILKPAMNALAADLDAWALRKAVLATSNLVGTAGVQSGSVLQFLQARQRLVENLVPKDNNIYSFITPATNTAASDARKGYFNPSEELSKIYKQGFIGQGQGQTYVESNLLPTLTNGNDVTGAAVDDTVANGDTVIHIDGITTGTGTVAAGSVFTAEGSYAVHPLTKATLPYLKQWCVEVGGTASGTSDIDLTLTEPIYGPGSGSLQNCSALPANDAPIVFFGAASTAYEQNLTFHKSAMRFCTVPLFLPEGVDFKGLETVDGISVAVVRDFLPLTREEIMRFDVLAGGVAVRPEWMVRCTG